MSGADLAVLVLGALCAVLAVGWYIDRRAIERERLTERRELISALLARTSGEFVQAARLPAPRRNGRQPDDERREVQIPEGL